jgi:hypothetical protein
MPAGLRKRKSRTNPRRGAPAGNGADSNGRAASKVASLAQRAGIGTWPRKIAAAVLGALLASAAGYFLGADFWKNVEKEIGTAGAPVVASTVTDIDRFNSDVVHVPEFVVARPVGKVPPPPNGESPDGRFAWAKEIGGVDATATLFRVVLSGREAAPVVLQGLDVKVVERRPAMRGTLLSYFGLGAPQSVRFIQIDLSKDPPAWDYIGDRAQPEDHFPLRVSSSESEVFDVQAFAGRGDVSWYLEFQYTADGENGTVRVDDGGKPFRTTERDAAEGYGWLNGRWTSLSNPE